MATVVKAINERIIRSSFCAEKEFFNRIKASGDIKLIRYLIDAIKTVDSNEQMEGIFFVMEGLPIAHEAFVIKNKYEKLKHNLQKTQNILDGLIEDTETEVNILRNELNDKLSNIKQAIEDLRVHAIMRLPQIMRQTLNRLLLEEIMKGCIHPLNLSPGDGRVHGQTPDELRTGGLKIVSRVLQRDIRNTEAMDNPVPVSSYQDYCSKFRVFANEPRHLLRAISPSASDVVFGHRLGVLAVDNAMAGYTDFLVSQWLTEYVLIPLELVVLGRKRVPPDGIFWKSVLAKTKTSEIFNLL